MSENKGRPSGDNKSDMGTGVPQKNIENKDLDRDKEITEQYTNQNKEVSDSVRQNNPNRNTDKTDATNAGGYKN